MVLIAASACTLLLVSGLAFETDWLGPRTIMVRQPTPCESCLPGNGTQICHGANCPIYGPGPNPQVEALAYGALSAGSILVGAALVVFYSSRRVR